ncbi:MAG: hypothetical protein Q4A31_10355 [Corynebacterium sp.]|uniref:hypothetical protein n=1 Tax=Corynebacterium sp. TaxID=1720 RepID=UPI0026DBDC82|nr:hypothetical protein [Corynebacterium sp.]MDO4762310.1 hypothetical protein [Corynebacterium sp.]
MALTVKDYDPDQLASVFEIHTYRQPHYLVVFWELRDDPTGFGDKYWHEFMYLVSGAKNVLEVIEWEKAHANNRPSATFGLFRDDIMTLPMGREWTPVEGQSLGPDLTLLLHGEIPIGRRLNETNFFEF